MSTLAEKLKHEVLALPQSERRYVADALLASFDDDDSFEVSPEWLAEAQRRGREIDSGLGRTISGDEAVQALREPIAR